MTAAIDHRDLKRGPVARRIIEAVREVASWMTPVPGSVGPVTVAILLRNTMVALKRQRQAYEAVYGLREDGLAAAE